MQREVVIAPRTALKSSAKRRQEGPRKSRQKSTAELAIPCNQSPPGVTRANQLVPVAGHVPVPVQRRTDRLLPGLMQEFDAPDRRQVCDVYLQAEVEGH